MKDQELFDLCDQVKKNTGWWDPTMEWLYADSDCECGHKNMAPLYTSDYLLEKLPAQIVSHEKEGHKANLVQRKELNDPDDVSRGNVYFAWYTVYYEDDPADYGVHADTPLKALLKLTLALHEAGELK